MALDIPDHRVRGVLVVFQFRELEELGGADEAFAQRADADDDLLERGALAAEGLRVLGVVPDLGAFQLPVYFFETFDLLVEVKDTPGANPADREGRRFAGGRDSARSCPAQPRR
jgi:hypothetical protein